MCKCSIFILLHGHIALYNLTTDEVNIGIQSENSIGTHLEGYILLHDALQIIHLLAHGTQSLLHFIDLHLAPLPVALLGLLVLQLLPGGAIGATQGACMHNDTTTRSRLRLDDQIFLHMMPGCAISNSASLYAQYGNSKMVWLS